MALGYDPRRGPQRVVGGPRAAHEAQGADRTDRADRVEPSAVYDRNLHRSRPPVSLSALAFLYMEIVRRHFRASSTLPQVERALNSMGYPIGARVLALESLRANFSHSVASSGKSNTATRLSANVDVLHFVTGPIWQSLFGKPADSLERSTDNPNNYLVVDNDPLFTRHIANGIPQEYASLNCEAFVAGILEGILDAAYCKCEVSAHALPSQGFPAKTVYLVKFLP